MARVTNIPGDITTLKDKVSSLENKVPALEQKNTFNDSVTAERTVAAPTSEQVNYGAPVVSRLNSTAGGGRVETEAILKAKAKNGYPSHAIIAVKRSATAGEVQWLLGSDGHFYFPGPDGYFHSGNMSFHFDQDQAEIVFDQTKGLKVEHSLGKAFTFQCSGTSQRNATLNLWGSGDRSDVIEFGTSEGYLFYVQQLASGARELTMNNGAINCRVVNQSSDKDLKDKITIIDDATGKLRKINGYSYIFKDDGMPYAGVIAQEIMEVLPEAIGSRVHYDGGSSGMNGEKGKTFYTVDYSGVVGLLVQVCRESDDRITKLENEISELKAAIATLTANN